MQLWKLQQCLQQCLQQFSKCHQYGAAGGDIRLLLSLIAHINPLAANNSNSISNNGAMSMLQL